MTSCFRQSGAMRTSRMLACAAWGMFAVAALAASTPEIPAEYSPQEGDIIFQSLSGSELTDMIEGATGSRFSHCGIVVRRGDKWMVLEAIGPVKETVLSNWIQRGSGAEFAAYRLES